MARISKEKQEEIRQRIKDVSRKLFEEEGFEATSTKRISKEVGIAEGTLFNYFDSKTEIFFESFGDDYESIFNNSDGVPYTLGDNVTEMIFERFDQALGMMLKLPRGVMAELGIASIRMAKKKPERFKRLMALDFQFIDELAIYIQQLIEKGYLKDVNHTLFSETIFAVIGYELLLYVYDKNIKKQTMLDNLKKKIDILIQGYVKEDIQ